MPTKAKSTKSVKDAFQTMANWAEAVEARLKVLESGLPGAEAKPEAAAEAKPEPAQSAVEDLEKQKAVAEAQAEAQQTEAKPEPKPKAKPEVAAEAAEPQFEIVGSEEKQLYAVKLPSGDYMEDPKDASVPYTATTEDEARQFAIAKLTGAPAPAPAEEAKPEPKPEPVKAEPQPKAEAAKPATGNANVVEGATYNPIRSERTGMWGVKIVLPDGAVNWWRNQDSTPTIWDTEDEAKAALVEHGVAAG